VEARAPLNVQDSKGNTALHYAVINNKEVVVKNLCFSRCNVNLLNKENKSPLHLATEREFQNVADMLVSSGADVSIRFGIICSISNLI
jgi:ankyrin repeat protein